jgi:Galactose oxidase-like, Early set domain/Bacterial Ig domain
VRILEYSGIATTNPVDVVAVSSSTVTANSGLPSFTNTVHTNFAPDLLVAGNTVEGTTTGPSDYFVGRFLTKPDSNIAEDRIVTVPGFYSAASDGIDGNSSWVMQMVAFKGATPQAADGTPPTVSISAPSSASGTIDVTTTATDNPGGTGVLYVSLTVDGIPYTTAGYAPFAFLVDTTEFTNGAHTLVATAFDAAGNAGASAPVTVSMSNSGPDNPALFGQVSPLAELPIVSVNSALLPDGTVLFYDGEAFGWTAITWDPIKDQFNWVPAPIGTDLFCSAIQQMADGEIMVAGGTQMNMAGTNNMDDFGLQSTSKFNVLTQSWTALPPMNFPRWYPTATILSDGRILVTSGEQNGVNTDAPISEIYSTATNTWTPLSNAQFPYRFFYPHVFQLSAGAFSGKVFVPSVDQGPIISQILDLNAQTWIPIGSSSVIDSGLAIQYLPNKFLKTGHSTNPGVTPYTNSIANAYTIDMTATNPTWTQIAPMAFARTYHNMTSLPDGTVLVTGGGENTNPGNVGGAILPTELWNPATGAWKTLAGINSPRIYHSEAILLPDARVLISGGGRFNNDNPPIYQYSAEFFSPPYLFNGPRPTISGVSTASPALGSAFTVSTPNAASITAVSLIRFGSATHTFNMSQKFIPLAFTAGAGGLTVTAPANSLLAPPGNYMLFILSNGIPSKAAILHF